MFDRILQIINKCSNETFPKQVVDDALMVYFEKGRIASEQFLITAKKFSTAQATELVSSIEKENNRLNRQAFLINSIGFSAMLILFFLSAVIEAYFFVVIYAAASILWGMAWRRSLVRLARQRKRERQSESEGYSS